MVEVVEHPHPVKAMSHELLELHLNNLHLLLLPAGRAHDQLSYLSGLLLVKRRNGASAEFLM